MAVWSYFHGKTSRRRLLLLLIGILVVTVKAFPKEVEEDGGVIDEDIAMRKALRYMAEVPLIDGHNDWAYQMVIRIGNKLQDLDLDQDLSLVWEGSHTDIPRLKKGRVGGQFWSAYTTCGSQYMDAVTRIIDQIDVIIRMCEKYPDVFEFVTTADGIVEAHRNGKIASLIGVEGGHNMDSSLATLRMLYRLGVRYMTITHSCNTPWADNWLESGKKHPKLGGLSDYGKRVIAEMNRLGMLVDLAHVSEDTMSDTLDLTKAPVIFSHSSAYALCNHYRNVPDDILKRVADNKGVVMVNFFTQYINCPPNNIPPNHDHATLSQVADHMEHIKNVCGWECVGVGSDFDGIPYSPRGLEDVSKFPNLVAELIRRGWSEEEVKGAIGNNLLRVLRRTEQVRDELAGTLPDESLIPIEAELSNKCRTVYYRPQTSISRAKRSEDYRHSFAEL